MRGAGLRLASSAFLSTMCLREALESETGGESISSPSWLSSGVCGWLRPKGMRAARAEVGAASTGLEAAEVLRVTLGMTDAVSKSESAAEESSLMLEIRAHLSSR